ncbi:MAG TPA: kelch repeat-containing protein, partial [Pyrinomonadaceae bacterium]|nr:kelch repeat-containing protein [Pyrinomonadaceae bacterium]
FTSTVNPGEPNLVPVNRIAKYEFPSDFHPWYPVPGEGFDGEVRALAIEDSILIAGGTFTRSFNNATLDLGNIAFVGDVNAENWEALAGEGLNNTVNALAINPGNTINQVFVGGTFTQSGDGMLLTNLKSLISLDMPIFNFSDSLQNGTSSVDWANLGFSNVKALNNEVQAMTADANGMIYVGGSFSGTADGVITNLSRIARYNPATKTWSALPNNGLNGPVFALAVSGDNLYVGGQFSQTANGAVTNLNNIAVYNLTTNTWSPLPGNGLNNWVYDLAVSGNTLFVGGIFTRTFNSSVLNLNRVARFNTSTNTWSTVSGNGLNNSVFAMALMGDNLYFGGAFTATQTFTAFQNLNRIARYNIPTNTWFLVPTNGLNNAVIELAVLDNFLYLRGSFTATVDSPTSLDRLARFDTATNQWSPITNNRDLALETAEALHVGNELYIGGSFTDLGEGTARHFTRIYLQQWNVPAANSDWFDNTNWRLGTFPSFNSSVVIPTGAGNINIINIAPRKIQML